MPAKAVDSAPSGQLRQPHNPISRRQIETVVSRSVAVFGLVFGAQALPVVFSQLAQLQAGWGYSMAVAIYGAIVISLVASLARRLVTAVYAFIAFAFLVSLIAWPFVQVNQSAVADDRPWLWLICTVATSAAAVAFGSWYATIYLFVAPILYCIVRVTPSGGGKSWESAALDTIYAVILGGAVLILVTLLRQAAADVDSAQAAALNRYAHAVRQHATEVERVQVDAIVHDGVLTTLLSAARAVTPEAKMLATRMARDAMGHLKDAAAASPDDEATVSMNTLAHRVIGATTTLSSPFELRSANIESGDIPIQSAEAVYSAAVQAMVNSLQHAGAALDLRRWLDVRGAEGGGIRIDVGDTGEGFDVSKVPTERLGLRVSIIERVANAGGSVRVDSGSGRGTIISIRWPAASAVAVDSEEESERITS